jgi:hypothetical protein
MPRYEMLVYVPELARALGNLNAGLGRAKSAGSLASKTPY